MKQIKPRIKGDFNALAFADDVIWWHGWRNEKKTKSLEQFNYLD